LAGLPYWNSMTQSGCSAAICLAVATAWFEPPAAGEKMISAPYIRSSCTRSAETFSGITQTSRYPRSLATMAREMPVLPLVGSRMVSPGRSRPAASASRTMNSAGRSLMLPVGLRSSSFAHRRTGGAPSGTVGDRRGRPTSGVPPHASSRLS
jgi:hypothetical protein